MPGMDQPLDSEKDIPLREDIRLLGRILGDTVRSQEGDAVFDIIEGIRQSSIRFRRDEDQVARRELEAALNRLSRDETIQIIRAFSYFSHLANIAEDQHHIRRTRAHVGVSAPREGSIAHALARAQRAGIARFAPDRRFRRALICPVLTAHPTEVRRKSTIVREMEVAALLALRMQSGRALSFYLDELHLLGAELSLDARLVGVSDELRVLADRSPDRSPHREDEPYRRAISGIYARVAATAWTLDEVEAPRHAVGEAPPYANPEE